eukprot:2124558-Amphidinium_carterae.1
MSISSNTGSCSIQRCRCANLGDCRSALVTLQALRSALTLESRRPSDVLHLSKTMSSPCSGRKHHRSHTRRLLNTLSFLWSGGQAEP